MRYNNDEEYASESTSGVQREVRGDLLVQRKKFGERELL